MSNFGGPDLILLLLFFLTVALPIWMLIDCIIYESNKAPWILLILFIPWLGPAIYYFARRSPRVHRKA
jgi:hypothetical protein